MLRTLNWQTDTVAANISVSSLFVGAVHIKMMRIPRARHISHSIYYAKLFTWCRRPDMTASCEKTLTWTCSTSTPSVMTFNKLIPFKPLQNREWKMEFWKTCNVIHQFYRILGVVSGFFSQQISVKLPLAVYEMSQANTHLKVGSASSLPSLVFRWDCVEMGIGYILFCFDAHPHPKALFAREADRYPPWLLHLCLCYMRT